MQQALRPYLTTGIAVVGATALLTAPVVATPTLPDLQSYEVQLTAGLGDLLDGGFNFLQIAELGSPTDPIGAYTHLVTNTFTNLVGIGGNWLDQPFPIAQAVIHNQLGYLTDAIGNPGSILTVPQQMFGHFGDVFGHLTNILPSITPSADALIGLDIGLPVPLVMALAAAGPLANGMGAFNGSFNAFQTALGSGDILGTLATLVAGPGYIGDAMLNGSLGLDLGLAVNPSLADIVG